MRDRETAPLGRDNRGIPQECGNWGGVERGGHDDKCEVFAQRRVALDTERETEIGIEGAFVKFIEDHSAHTRKFGIGLDHARQDAFGHDFDPRVRPDLALAAHRIAYGFTNGISKLGCEPFSRCARGKAARLQHHDFASDMAGFEQGERHAAGFARTWGRLQNRHAARFYRMDQLWQDIVDGQKIVHPLHIVQSAGLDNACLLGENRC